MNCSTGIWQSEDVAIDAIAIKERVAWGRVPREGLSNLLCRPIRGGKGGDVGLIGDVGTPGGIRTPDLLLRRQSHPFPPFQYLTSFLCFPPNRGICSRSQVSPFSLNLIDF